MVGPPHTESPSAATTTFEEPITTTMHELTDSTPLLADSGVAAPPLP